MILLVWNIQSTLRHRSFSGGSEGPPAAIRPPALPDNRTADGPRSLRQEYLLGNKVDINRATLEEIDALPGISGIVAQAVIEARTRRKGFRSLGELLEVPGIKEKRWKKILPFLEEIHNN